jgi:hypothetical protein
MEVKSQQKAEGSSLERGVGMGCGVREPEQFFYFCADEPSDRPLNYGQRQQRGQMVINTAILTPSSRGALQPYS